MKLTMSEGDDPKGSGSKTLDKKPTMPPFIGEVTTIRRSINGLKWRHKQLHDGITERLQEVSWNTRRYKEVMEMMTIHRDRFNKLDEKYLYLYQLLEGDSTKDQGYHTEWDILIKRSNNTGNAV